MDSKAKRRNLVVSSDNNDANAGVATVLDGINDLLAWWIQHADHSNERTVRLHTQRNALPALSDDYNTI